MKSTSVIRTVVRYAVVGLAVAVISSVSGMAFAKDSLQVSVSNATGSPVIVHNGTATGTIQLFYTVSASDFTPGPFATFQLDWLTIGGSGRQATNYGPGVSLELAQDQKGGHVELTPSPDSFMLTSAGQTGSSLITVSIVNGKDGNPPSNADGTDLVGNLKIHAGNDVATVTNIQVHILLQHPTNCIKVYNFVTDQDFNVGILSTANLNSPTSGRNAGKVNSSQPGQFSDNVLVSNACGAAHAFDLRVTLDPNFSTNPSNNPGNAVFAYSASGEFDPTTFGALLAQTSVGYQQKLCLQNLTVEPNSSLLVTVHAKTKDDLLVSALPADKTFRFNATLFQNVNQSCSGSLDALATPNPASFALPFTVNGN